MTPLLPSGATPIALLPAHAGIVASAPTLTVVESPHQPRYKFALGKQVYVERTHYEFGARSVYPVTTEEVRQIVNRQRLKNLKTGQMENWYTMSGFPEMVREKQLSLKARYKTRTFERRMTVAA